MPQDDPRPAPEDEPVSVDHVISVELDENGALAEGLSLEPENISATLSGLQAELAGTASTGIPAVDAALERLADIDPNDLAGSAGILADVLQRLESAMGAQPSTNE